MKFQIHLLRVLSLKSMPSTYTLTFFFFSRALPMDFVRLDQDILSPLAGKKKLYTYETMDFWEQIKTPG